MVEPPAGIVSQPGASGTDVLLATKLYVPRLSPSFVARPRLAARLTDGLSRGVVMVSAPAAHSASRSPANSLPTITR